MFSALHDHLASLNNHVQLTRCFSAVAGLLVGQCFDIRINFHAVIHFTCYDQFQTSD